MPKVVLASNNAGKLWELTRLLAPRNLEVIPQGDLNVPEAEETGSTFVENALLKARNACAHTGLPAIADDSGLQVDALGGAPGIYSARYAGANATDELNNQALLDALEQIDSNDYSASYHCCIVYMRSETDPVPIIAEGRWQGQMITEPQGSSGFGYDPYFYLPQFSKTAAELGPDAKNKLSHRAKALAQLLRQLSLG